MPKKRLKVYNTYTLTAKKAKIEKNTQLAQQTTLVRAKPINKINYS